MADPLIPKIDWAPSPFARIEPNPPRPRQYGESTMSDEDYAAAQERAAAGVLCNWGSCDERPPEHDRPRQAIPHPDPNRPWLPERVGGLKDPL